MASKLGGSSKKPHHLAVNESIGDAGSVAIAKANIAYAKSLYEDGDSEELLKVS